MSDTPQEGSHPGPQSTHNLTHTWRSPVDRDLPARRQRVGPIRKTGNRLPRIHCL